MTLPSRPTLVVALSLLGAPMLGCDPGEPVADASVADAEATVADADTTVVDADATVVDAAVCVDLGSNCENDPCCGTACCGQPPASDGGIAPWPSCMTAAPAGGFCYP